jgi:hypothetical protein
VRSEDRARHDGSICGSGSPELAFGADSKRSAPPDKTLPQKGTTALEGRANRAMPSSRITTSLRDSTRRLACPTTISATFRGVTRIHRTGKQQEKNTKVGASADSPRRSVRVRLEWTRCWGRARAGRSRLH